MKARKLFRFGAISLIFAMSVMNTSELVRAIAISDDLVEKYDSYQIYFYNEQQQDAEKEKGKCVPKDPTGSSRAEYIWKYLIGRGLTPEQAAGVLGNMATETGSTFNPFIQNSIGCTGLIQWCPPNVPVYSYLEEQGLDEYFYKGGEPALDDEIIYKGINAELHILFDVPHGNSISLFTLRASVPTNTSGVSGARAYADLFLVTVERAVGGSDGLEDDGVKAFIGRNDYQGAVGRRNHAEDYYNQFKDTGDDLEYCDEEEEEEREDWSLVFYSQCDSKWKNYMYGAGGLNGTDGTSICASGCGPTSFAVIAANLKRDTSITPDKTADLAGKAGMHVKNEDGEWVGSSWGITSYLAGQYGLSATKINGSISTIDSYLESGYMIHTSGTGDAPFTSNGHFITIVKKTSDGKWLVGDSSSRGPSGTYDPTTVILNMSADNIWAVKK